MTVANVNLFDVLWRQFEMQSELLKHYFEVVLKILVVFLTLSGAVLSFCVVHSEDALVRWALLFPAFLGIPFCILAILAIQWAKVSGEAIEDIAGRIGLDAWPTDEALVGILVISAAVFFIVSIFSIWVFFPRKVPSQ